MIFAFFAMLGVIFACAEGPGWTVAAVVCFLAAAVAANQPDKDDDYDPPL